MSGIVGILRRDGASVRETDLQCMLNAIPHRGNDRAAVWSERQAGLGNRLLRTTPESLHEVLPQVSRSGAHVLAADARIDNRDELIARLNLSGSREVITDSDLILAAWDRWGENCPEHLIGDFSFAIWDRHQEKLFCARDSAGIRCLYYYQSRDTFAFASEIKALTALPFVPCALNELRVADYLVNLYEDRSITFYKDIFRLPPASTLVVSRGQLAVRTYWKLDPRREIRLRDDREYADAFREQFTEAVRCRVRSSSPIGSAVSGGLDSSAIACTARNIMLERDANAALHTFSLIFPESHPQDLRAIDERPWIDKVLEAGNVTPHFVRGDKLNPLQDARLIHYHLDEANFAPNLYLHWNMYGSAREHGVRVFLDGLDGDTTVSHGFEYLEELARGFRWGRLYREGSLLATNLFKGSNPRRVLWRYCFRDMAPSWMVGTWRLLHGRFREVRSNGTLAHPEFTKRMALRKRVGELTKSQRPRTAREYHARVLNLSLYAHALEMADKATAAFGIEARYPFFDRRLIEFCLALPPDQKLAGGWNRSVFRRAMEGILPPGIQWRTSKGNLSPNFHRNLIDLNSDTLDAIASQNDGAFSQYVNTAAMRTALSEYKAAPLEAGMRHSIRLFVAANLAIWLEQAPVRTVARSVNAGV